MKLLSVLFSLLVLVAACAKRQMVATTPSIADAPISLSADWLKSRGHRTEVHVTIINKTDKTLSLHLQDLHCTRGNAPGSVHHKFQTSPFWGQIRLNPHETASNLIFCDFDDKKSATETLSLHADKKRLP